MQKRHVTTQERQAIGLGAHPQTAGLRQQTIGHSPTPLERRDRAGNVRVETPRRRPEYDRVSRDWRDALDILARGSHDTTRDTTSRYAIDAIATQSPRVSLTVGHDAHDIRKLASVCNNGRLGAFGRGAAEGNIANGVGHCIGDRTKCSGILDEKENVIIDDTPQIAVVSEEDVAEAVAWHEASVARPALEDRELVAVETVETIPCGDPDEAIGILQHLSGMRVAQPLGKRVQPDMTDLIMLSKSRMDERKKENNAR